MTTCLPGSATMPEPAASGESDHQLAARLADSAGSLLARTRRGFGDLDEQSRREMGDATSQRYLTESIAEVRPGDGVLSEEAKDSADRLDAPRVWIIDPLDGTREFAEGRGDWAVHVALWADDQLVAGAVATPSLGATLRTDDPPVVQEKNGARRLRIAVSRSRPPAAAERAAAALDAELVPLGSAGYKTAAVLRGDVDAYVHDGGQFEWDS